MKLLVPLDLSPVTARVLDVAGQVARATGARLQLLHVAEPDPAFVGYQAGPEVVREQVAHELREQHAQLQAHAGALRARGLDASALQVRGAIAQSVLAEAGRMQADLIVMATHGRGAMFGLLVGSISHAVLRDSAIPVLLVPARAEPRGGEMPGG